MILLLTILSFKKGGFYKTDALFFHVFILGLGTVYQVYFIVKDKTWKQKKPWDPIAILLLFLPLAYYLPILFQTSASMTDSIEELLRYFDLYLVYQIVKQSTNKKIYLYGIVGMTLLQFIIGIDGIANRYLQDMLHHLNSGFLSNINVTRMSGTIQYANIFAILCAISFFIVHHKAVNKEKQTRKKQVVLSATKNTLSVIFLMGIFLSGSRMVCFITAVCMIFDIITTSRSNKKIKIVTLLILLVMAGIGSMMISSLMMISPGTIYITCIVFIAIIWSLILVASVIFSKEIVKIPKKYQYASPIIAGTVVFLVVLGAIVMLQTRAPIVLTEHSLERTVTRNFYPVQKGKENTLEIHTKSLQEDTRYEIQVIAVKEQDETELLDTFHYYDNTTGNYVLTKQVPEDIKYWMVRIYLEQGQLQVTKLLLNEKTNGLNYAFLPSELWYRFQDNTTKNTGTYQRLAYYKDALTLVKESPKTLLFGIGGGGFEAKYETIKSSAYTSTEVHSGLLQILVETGLVGTILFILVICFTVTRSKCGLPRLILALLLLHTLVDLEFSYTLMLMIFGILLGLQEEKTKPGNRGKENSTVTFAFSIVGVLFGMTLFVIASRQWFAYEMKVPKETQEQTTLEHTIEMVTAHEKRVTLDPFDPHYRESLNTAYEAYLISLASYIESQGNTTAVFQTEYQNVLSNLITNTNLLQSQNPDQKNILLAVSKIWITHFLEFSLLYHTDDLEKGYELYLGKVVENVTKVQRLPYQEQATRNANQFLKEAVVSLKEVNETKSSSTIEKYIQILENSLT